MGFEDEVEQFAVSMTEKQLARRCATIACGA
jgi:hypothetical protein